jgi:site-specific recombinase XerD
MRISPLRQRMIDDMTARQFGEKGQKDYIRCVKNFAIFIERSPDTATLDDLRRFRLHLIDSALSPSSVNTTMQALKFFFSVTLDRPDLLKALFRVQAPQKLPTVLTQEEVARLLDAVSGAKCKAALSVAYGAGLRASEVVSLKVSDIDSVRMVLRVEQGKGRKDRHAMLSPMLLNILRDWWQIGRPNAWLFPGQNPVNPLTPRQLNRACHAAAHIAEINKRVSMHTLRHSFATHLLEQDIDIRVIQVLLGHAKLNTTALYTRVATSTIRKVMSPLDRLSLIETPKAGPKKNKTNKT